MPEPTITVPWTDDSMEMLDWNKVKVNGELATDLLAQRNALRAELQTWQEGCACTDKSKAGVHALRVRVEELEAWRDNLLSGFLDRATALDYEPGEIVLAKWDGASLECITDPEKIRSAFNLSIN